MASTVQQLLQKIPLPVQQVLARLAYALPRPLRRLLIGKPVRVDGLELSSDAQLFLLLARLTGVELTASGDVLATRKRMDEASALTAKHDVGPVSVRTVDVPGPAGPMRSRLYTPAGAPDGTPLLVFFHGGGWVVCSLDTHDNACRYLAANGGLRVLSVDYRMAPEAPFPAAVDDALAAFRWAVKNAAELGADPNAIAVGGDSAGGNLAAVVSHLTTRRRGAKPAFQLLFYPATDASVHRRSRELFGKGFFLTSAEMDVFLNHYAPDPEQLTDPRLSVLLADNLAGLPPAYIVTAGFDPLRDEGEAYAKKLAEAGVPVVLRRQADLIHGFINYIGFGTRFTEALSEAVGALRTGLAIGTTPAKPATPRKRTTPRKSA